MVRKSRIKSLLTAVVVLGLIGFDRCLEGVRAIGGLNLLSCFSRGQPEGSNNNLVHPWKEVYELIDTHLSDKIRSDDLDMNLEELENLLAAEYRSGATRSGFFCNAGTGQSAVCISRKLKSKDKEVAKNALSKLLNLENNHDCLIATTNNLAELNEMTMNPIGRCDRGQSSLLPRIDRLIFNAALGRAMNCLPKYREQLLRTSSLSDKRISAIKIFWDQILERRLSTLNEDLDEVFRQHPREAIELIKRMNNAIDWDEMFIAQANLKYGVASPLHSSAAPSERSISKRFDYNRAVKVPCTDFRYMVSGIFQSLDFDLQLRNFVPNQLVEQSELDHIVNRQRAYYLMCEKALQEEDRFNDILWDLGGSRRIAN